MYLPTGPWRWLLEDCLHSERAVNSGTAAGGLPTHYSFFPLSGLEPALHAHISKVPREDGLALL